jgi:hypothetical protein
MENFGHLVCANLMSFKFSLRKFLVLLYIFKNQQVFRNEVLDGFDDDIQYPKLGFKKNWLKLFEGSYYVCV